MTIEEKATAYDELLKKIQPLYNQAKKDDNPLWATYEYLVPQLAENEDEKTRKFLIDFVKLENGVNLSPDVAERCIAYLEKLKEKKDYRKLYEDIAKSDWFKKNYVGKSLGENPYDFAMSRQKEQSWMPTEKEMGVLYKLCYVSNQISDDDDTELTHLYQDLKQEYFNGHSFENMFSKTEREQKPAERSEDERIRKEIVKFIKDNTLTYTHSGCEIQKRWIDYLENQKEQKPAECSEDESFDGSKKNN